MVVPTLRRVLNPVALLLGLLRFLLAPAGLGTPSRPQLRWSTPPEEVVASLVARQAFTVAVQRHRPVRRAPRVQLLFVPLAEVRRGALLGSTARDWFVWTSASARGTVTRLPTDPDRLGERLALPRGGDGPPVREAVHQLSELLYGERLA